MKIKQPHTCPVCNGQGNQSMPPWVHGDQTEWSTTTIRTYPCKPCNGTGIIWGEIDTEDVYISGAEAGALSGS